MFTDNMPFSSQEMRSFAAEYDFQIITSSPRYPQSNGFAERSVRIVKSWLKKSVDLSEALLEYHNTPITGMPYSPAQLLMSRNCRTKVPSAPKTLQPKLNNNVTNYLRQLQYRQKYQHDKNAKPMKPLSVGQPVRIVKPATAHWSPAKVTAEYPTPRSYVITTDDGTTYRRTRQHIKEEKSVMAENVGDRAIEPDNDEENQQPQDTSGYENPQDTTSCGNPEIVRCSNRNRQKPEWHKDYVM